MWVFAGCTGHFVGFVVQRLKCINCGNRYKQLHLSMFTEKYTPSENIEINVSFPVSSDLSAYHNHFILVNGMHVIA